VSGPPTTAQATASQHYLSDVRTRIADHPAHHIADPPPWNWQPAPLLQRADAQLPGCRSLFVVEAETLASKCNEPSPFSSRSQLRTGPVSIWRNPERGYQPTPPRCIARASGTVGTEAVRGGRGLVGLPLALAFLYHYTRRCVRCGSIFRRPPRRRVQPKPKGIRLMPQSISASFRGMVLDQQVQGHGECG
jgi:hypothetical protein